MLDRRPEGIYLEWIDYPGVGLAGDEKLLRLDRVRGDQTTVTSILTTMEACAVRDFLIASIAKAA